MTKFENNGINRLLYCCNQQELQQTFEVSCQICGSKNVRVECNRCAIKACYMNMTGVFADRNKNQRFTNGRKDQRKTELN